MIAVGVKLPSTTKSCGTSTTRQAESSVPGAQWGSLQPPPGAGGAGGFGGVRARDTHPVPPVHWSEGPIQHEDEGWQFAAPGGHHCHTAHVSSAQQASWHAFASPA